MRILLPFVAEISEPFDQALAAESLEFCRLAYKHYLLGNLTITSPSPPKLRRMGRREGIASQVQVGARQRQRE